MIEIIKPTVGRIVWHYGLGTGGDPLAAIITYVLTDRMVNLCAFTMQGGTLALNSQVLMQPGDDQVEGQYCTWMPYQIKKATGSESGEKAAGTEVIGTTDDLAETRKLASAGEPLVDVDAHAEESTEESDPTQVSEEDSDEVGEVADEPRLPLPPG